MTIQTKKQRIRTIKRRIGWAYSQLKWLTAEEATRAMEDREQLLRALSGKVNESYLQNKLHQGPLSPGCVTCGDGTWSCLYINGLCTARCFFCPQDRAMKEERPPMAEKIVFQSPKDYVDFVQKIGFKGVGFSGGETLLVYDTLLVFIEELRKRLGNDIYLWIYTNGDLVDREKLEGLKQAGLNEIRFDIAARNYALRSVELAMNFMDRVTVEIPAIPEDLKVVKAALSTMESMGVHHLNLHQLLTTKHNYSALARRNYTFLHHAWVPVLESEMTALRLLLHAVENGISLPINYCSQAYKDRLQGRGFRMRAASLVRESFEDITDSGYIRRLTIQGVPARLERIAAVLSATECSNSCWSLSADRSCLVMHSSLLRHIDECDDCSFTLSYFSPSIKDGSQPAPPYTDADYGYVEMGRYESDLRDDGSPEKTVQELVLNPERTLVAVKKLAAEHQGLSLVTIRSFQKLFIDKMSERKVLRWFTENYDVATKKVQDMAREKTILLNLRTWEQVSTGFPELY